MWRLSLPKKTFAGLGRPSAATTVFRGQVPEALDELVASGTETGLRVSMVAITGQQLSRKGEVFVAGRVVPVRVGDVEVLVETVLVAGTEPTSRLGDAGERVGDAFDRAQEVIVGVAVSTMDVLAKLGARAARPDKLEVEFGLSFSAKGNVIVAGAEGGATLKVKLSYDAKSAG